MMEWRRDWLGALLRSNFGNCEEHRDKKFNEKNVFCIDCKVSLCRHCKEPHAIHRKFQIYKYSYQEVVRHSDIQHYFDCASIQTYVSNNDKIVHLRPRTSYKEVKLAKRLKLENLNPEPQGKGSTPLKWGGSCEECGKHLQDDKNLFCSITCKVSLRRRQGVNGEGITRRIQNGELILDETVKENSDTQTSISDEEPNDFVGIISPRKCPRKSNKPRRSAVFVIPY
ncbi:hypothetical protein RJT34_07462 [Clitoria ternatea]|uniref:B box-type domain-containing protein n=1 Tax=Clitoria ternatea TaxID=43366 RepID=A0AAN9K6K8_CLITE